MSGLKTQIFVLSCWLCSKLAWIRGYAGSGIAVACDWPVVSVLSDFLSALGFGVAAAFGSTIQSISPRKLGSTNLKILLFSRKFSSLFVCR